MTAPCFIRLSSWTNSKVFTKVDLSAGDGYVVLDHEFSYLTTFQTNRWLKLSVSSEIFQKRLVEVFDELSGVICIADNVIIYGKTMTEHNNNIIQFM